MNRKKHIIWLSSFILLLTLFALPSESSAKTVSEKVTINNIKLEGTINIYNNRASASTSASTRLAMTVIASYTYGVGHESKEVTHTISTSNGKTDYGVIASATANIHSPKSIRAAGTHTWSLPGNTWRETTNVTK